MNVKINPVLAFVIAVVVLGVWINGLTQESDTTRSFREAADEAELDACKVENAFAKEEDKRDCYK